MESIYKLVLIISFYAAYCGGQPTQNRQCKDKTECDRFNQLEQQLKESEMQIHELHNKLYKKELEIKNCNCQNCCNVSSTKPDHDPDSVKWLAGGKKIKDTYNNVLTKIIESNNNTEIFSYNSGYGYRMSVVDNKLWFASIEKKILSVELSNGESVEITQSTKPISFYLYRDNSILMASRLGLYVVNTTGSIQYKIGDSNGRVTDISVEGSIGVAYYYPDNSIVVLELNHNIWTIVSSFVTQLPSSHSGNTILLKQNTIILCSYNHGIIHTYNLEGQFNSSITTGQYQGPFLCGSDGEGSILVCDYGNKVLKVLTPSGEWQQYALPGIGNQNAKDVVINSNGEVYVLLFSPWVYTIVKYIV